MTSIISTLAISALVVLVCFITSTLFFYIYASRLDWAFDVPPPEHSPEEEMTLMMDAREGGLSRHWNWD